MEQQILWCFYRLWGADISVLSQVVILSVYEKKNGTDKIWCSCSPGIPLGFWAKILWSRGFTKILESQLHGSQRKSYLSAPFFFHLRCEWLVRGRLYMPNLRCESHHRICNLRYGMSAYIGFCCSYSGLTDFIDTIPRLLYTKPTSKSQTNNSYDYENFIIVIILNNVSVCRSKTWYMVTDMISKFSAGSAGDSILMNNSMHENFNLNYS